MYEAHAAAAYARTGEAPPPLSLVIEFNDVLTKRLLETQPGLLEPSRGGGGGAEDAAESAPPEVTLVEMTVFHRNYLETAALSISAHCGSGT